MGSTPPPSQGGSNSPSAPRCAPGAKKAQQFSPVRRAWRPEHTSQHRVLSRFTPPAPAQITITGVWGEVFFWFSKRKPAPQGPFPRGHCLHTGLTANEQTAASMPLHLSTAAGPTCAWARRVSDHLGRPEFGQPTDNFQLTAATHGVTTTTQAVLVKTISNDLHS